MRAGLLTGQARWRAATDWVDGGWNLEQTVEYAKELNKRGTDWVTASSGDASPLQKIPLGPGYEASVRRRHQARLGITVAVGLVTQAQQAENIIAGGKADLIALARAMLYDPRWG